MDAMDLKKSILPMQFRVVHTSGEPAFFSDATAPVSADLGLGEATSGIFTARRARAGNPASVAAIETPANPLFTFIYVLNGAATIKTGDARLTLNAHDAIAQTPLNADNILEISNDFEFLEILALDNARGREIFTKSPRRIVSQDAPSAHILGTGPRDFFDYRDLGVAEATDGLMEVQIIRAKRARENGTGWHWHNMAQLSYGLSGWAMLNVEGETAPVRQGVGDALSIPSHWCHNAFAFSDDYWALQMQIPADYATVQEEYPKSAPR